MVAGYSARLCRDWHVKLVIELTGSAAMRITACAALRPWSRLSPPARASAWSMFSAVMTPKAHGTPVVSATSWMPRAASAQTCS